jgi:hypothetical protein
VQLIRRSSQTGRRNLARTYRWVGAWLIAGGVLALLLLSNSIRDYLFVRRLMAIQQVRHELGQQAAALGQKLHRPSTPEQPPLEVLSDSMESALDKPLWMELRRLDGSVLARLGLPGARSFSNEEESSHFRGRQALYRTVHTAAGETVVEVFSVYAPGLTAPSAPATSGSRPSTARRLPLALEIAAPLVVRDAAVFWPIRRNLLINCSGALALLATVVIAGLGFRSYARGKRLEFQLEIARQVQSELLPSPMETVEPIRLATVYRPAEQVGGDFYDVFRPSDDRIAIVMGDVSGRGMPAALVMGVIHGAVRSSAWSESTSAHEWESARLNRLLCEKGPDSRYASMFWCTYEPLTRRLCYVNAGHYPPLLVGARSHGREITRLDTGGPVLGLLPEARYEQASCDVAPGDVLVLYSDGLTEATNAAGDEYGESHLRELLATAGSCSPDELRDSILASASSFLAAPPRDDLTLVVAQFA